MSEIKDSFFKAPDNNRYFRRNALAVTVGAYGEKKEPITQANYLAVEGNIRLDFLKGKIKKTEPIEIAWERESKADVEGDVKQYFHLGGVKLTFNLENAIKARLKLIRFHIDEAALKSILNTSANVVREAMKKEGKDARACSSIWAVVTAELAERFDTSVGIELSGTTPEGLSITAKGGGEWNGSEKVTFSPGTVFAYGLHKVKKWKGDMIDDMEDDFHGPN
jgi:hypothetical protein